MRKINNKGFVLVETLVTAVFVMTIFSLLYVNFYPMIGEYEKREAYDDVDSKYGVYWFKRIIEQDRVNFSSIINDINTEGYHQFSCDNDIIDHGANGIGATDYALCKNLISTLNVGKDDAGNPTIYITSYRLFPLTTDINKHPNCFKDEEREFDDDGYKCPKYLKYVVEWSPDKFLSGFSDYVMYLPRYNKLQSLNGANYRVFVAYHHVRGEDIDYWSYSTMEVIR